LRVKKKTIFNFKDNYFSSICDIFAEPRDTRKYWMIHSSLAISCYPLCDGGQCRSGTATKKRRAKLSPNHREIEMNSPYRFKRKN